jgi:hypothetical protein
VRTGAGRAFAAVTGASLLLATLLLWPRLTARDAGTGAAGPSSPPLLRGAPVASDSATPSTGASASRSATPADGLDGGALDGAVAVLDGGTEASLPAPVPSYVRVHPDTAAACPADMVLVEGVHCPFVAHRCEQPRGARPAERCDRYGQRFLCEGRPLALRFCMDRYEYPNQRGVRPAVLASYRQAADACLVEGKRLCEAEEWAMACEGPGTWPYPTGLVRDAAACNLDQPERSPDARALADARQVSIEMERLDGREPAGGKPACVSRWGLYDLGGNAQEWVTNRRGQRRGAERTSALAGGSWGREPATCRTLDPSHGEQFRSPNVGFRCCADGLDGRPTRRTLARGARLGRVQRVLAPEELPEPVAATPGRAGER